MHCSHFATCNTETDILSAKATQNVTSSIISSEESETGSLTKNKKRFPYLFIFIMFSYCDKTIYQNFNI